MGNLLRKKRNGPACALHCQLPLPFPAWDTVRTGKPGSPEGPWLLPSMAILGISPTADGVWGGVPGKGGTEQGGANHPEG